MELNKSLRDGSFYGCHPCIAPLVAAGLIAGGASLANSIIGSVGQSNSNANYLKGVRETNEANLQATRETNDANYRLFREQIAENRANFAIENDYNSASAQLARLRQAGINGTDSLTSSFAPIANVSAAPVQSSSSIAPEQTPSPVAGLNLNGAVDAFLDSYHKAQNIADTDLSLYQHGIESVFYYRSELSKVRSQELDLAMKETLSDKEREELSQLRIQGRYLEDQIEKHMRELDDAHENALKSGRKLDAETESIVSSVSRADMMALHEARNLDANAAATLLNAKTNSNLSKAQISNLTVRSMDTYNQIKYRIKTYGLRAAELYLKKQISDVSVDEKKVYTDMLIHHYMKDKERDNGLLQKFIRSRFGIDLNSVNPLNLFRR